ncbi:trehalose-phosphatase [Magnetospirillum sp. SS-4]|uniref:trehalose-phosphatase n=1 Tax=Magnetospirillum sp. SS-4 TaxID=2681465 RepID=UPI001380B8C0|nr:trehalose-phosphatase [Magnetospirillum sp. SS-4]CAA7620761.1 trehalose-6-phosphate phosphatase, biosynthetic [Magnetospirillum sp. SS-4]
MSDAAPPPLADWDGWALFLDIDGTLLDLAPTPDEVIVPATLPHRLDSLTAKLSGALALISGRSLTEIDRLFPDRHDVAGTHGVELRAGGVQAMLATAWPDDLTAAIRAAAGRLPGVLVERKTCAVALHHARVPHQAGAVLSLAESVIAGAAVPLRLLLGKGVVELVPDGAGKGRAIERFMENPPYLGRTPVFVGDDVTDEDGFAAVNRMGGMSIHVGDRPSAATYRLSNPASVRCWLAHLDGLTGDMNDHEHT